MPAVLEEQEHQLPFNEGEIALQKKLKVLDRLNPTSLFLTPNGQFLISHAPLLGLGALDAEGRPWSTVWGGEPGFASVIDRDIVGMRAIVDRVYDPVVTALFGDSNVADGSVMRTEGGNKMISGVTIDLEKRKRVKLYGKVVLGTLEDPEGNISEASPSLLGKRGHAQLVVKIEESLGMFIFTISIRLVNSITNNYLLTTVYQETVPNTFTRSISSPLYRNQNLFPLPLNFLPRR